jgi:hypothetical protein
MSVSEIGKDVEQGAYINIATVRMPTGRDDASDELDDFQLINTLMEFLYQHGLH